MAESAQNLRLVINFVTATIPGFKDWMYVPSVTPHG